MLDCWSSFLFVIRSLSVISIGMYFYFGRKLDGPDDGIVPLRSADPGGQIFNSLAHTDNCHTNLFTQEELDKAISILKS
jgi:hypothetical protein